MHEDERSSPRNNNDTTPGVETTKEAELQRQVDEQLQQLAGLHAREDALIKELEDLRSQVRSLKEQSPSRPQRRCTHAGRALCR